MLLEKTTMYHRERKYDEVDLNKIILPKFQRWVNPERVEKMVREYDPAKLSAPLLNDLQDGTFSSTDGSHRLDMLRSVGISRAMCAVICVPYEEEVELFLHQYDNNVKLSPLERFNALYEGGYEEAIRITEICQERGWWVPLRNIKQPEVLSPIVVSTPTGLEDVFKKHGEQELGNALSFIRSNWKGENKAEDANFTRGAALFLANYGGQVNGVVQARLSDIPPKAYINNAEGLGGQGSKARIIATDMRLKGGIRKRRSIKVMD